jgi:hypothetical protein
VAVRCLRRVLIRWCRTQSTNASNLQPQEVEAISMIANGFSSLADSNPELAYQAVVDLLMGINE